MLLHVADHYEAEVDVILDSLTAVIEPVLIVVLGGLLIAMYLPIFDLTSVVG